MALIVSVINFFRLCSLRRYLDMSLFTPIWAPNTEIIAPIPNARISRLFHYITRIKLRSQSPIKSTTFCNSFQPRIDIKIVTLVADNIYNTLFSSLLLSILPWNIWVLSRSNHEFDISVSFQWSVNFPKNENMYSQSNIAFSISYLSFRIIILNNTSIGPFSSK